MEFLIFLLVGGAFGFFVSHLRSRFLIEKANLEAKMARATLAESEGLKAGVKGLALEALQSNNHHFLQLAQMTFEKLEEKAKHEWEKKSLEANQALKPVTESLKKFDHKIEELEKSRVAAYHGLKEQVSHLIDTQKALKTETGNLVNALRAPATRGRWGEIQLRRVVELAGMLNHCDFYEQESVTTDEIRLRPDLIVKLPNDRNIIVDAKVPLQSYLEALETSDEEKKRLLLKDHARQVRAHMTQLGRKAYWDQFQPTPEFVVLFLPAETFFSAALEYDPTLIEGGVEERVILSTPTTLIALLKSIAYGWRQESLTKNAEEISQLGRELYKRLSDMTAHWTKLGKSLGGAVDAYNRASGSLESRVLVSARKFKDLETTGNTKEIEALEPIDQIPRLLNSDSQMEPTPLQHRDAESES